MGKKKEQEKDTRNKKRYTKTDAMKNRNNNSNKLQEDKTLQLLQPTCNMKMIHYTVIIIVIKYTANHDNLVVTGGIFYLVQLLLSRRYIQFQYYISLSSFRYKSI
jgi:hypothetical protein